MDVNGKLEQWKRELIDQSKRNKLLYFKPTKRGHIEIVKPDLDKLFEMMVIEQKTASIPWPKDENRESNEEECKLKDQELGTKLSTSDLQKSLYNIYLKARTSLEEQGVNVLYLTFGMLNWYEDLSSSTVESSPLILVPVELKRGIGGRPYELSMLSDEPVINPALQYSLKIQFGIELPDLRSNLVENKQALDDYLQNLQGMITEQESWTISSVTYLGLFSFKKFVMFKELDNYADLFNEHPIIRVLSGENREDVSSFDMAGIENLDDTVHPYESFQVLDADSSQQKVIEATKRGANLIVQGPPGTGKSQTIANIIAEALAQEKTVLFVSEKMAALKVVHDRLNSVGLGDFCLELHSNKANKRDVVRNISRVIENNTKSDTLDREMYDRLAQRRENLNSYVRQLHTKKTSLEITAYQAYARLVEVLDAPKVSFQLPDVTSITPEELDNWERSIGKLARQPNQWEQFSTHPWVGIKLSRYSFELENRLREAINELLDKLEEWFGVLTNLSKEAKFKLPDTYGELYDLTHTFMLLSPLFWESEREIGSVLGKDQNWLKKGSLRAIYPNYWWHSISTKIWFAERQDLEQRIQILMTLQLHAENGAVWQGNSESKRQVMELAKSYMALQESLQSLSEFMHIELIFPDWNLKEVPIEILFIRLKEKLTEINQLKDWIYFKNTLRELEDIGLKDFVAKCQSEDIEADRLVAIFRRRLYETVIDTIHSEDEILSQFKKEEHETLIEEFKELDTAILKDNRKRLQALMKEKIPNGYVQTDTGEMSILLNEATKKRRHKPLRQLFNEIPSVLSRVKPCLMMSPLSVSQYIDPLYHKFDLVIFDEASQVRPQDAVGSIVRANQVIVVGDNQQLPPTNFFETTYSDEDADVLDEDYDVYESVLDALGGSLPNSRLLWHYRSKSEQLIAFSNYKFYDGALYTFPEMSHQRSAVQFHHVKNGVYDRGNSRRNIEEAREVVQYIYEHYKKRPNRSLGIVALSENQKMAILETLEKELVEKDPDFNQWWIRDDEEAPFIKNLENVQGDERDVMFLSIGYGPDQLGKFHYSFGPLNREGGERRLNVAITRAKQEVHVFASFEARDMDSKRLNSRGPKLLNSYLRYAQFGIDTLKDEILELEKGFDSPFEEQVFKALTNAGLSVEPQVGSSGYSIDLGIKHPDYPSEYVLGVECDGRIYHSSKTARDRDRLRQEVLEQRGWVIHRIWSADWWQDPQRQVAAILEKVEDCINGETQGRRNNDEVEDVLQPEETAQNPMTAPIIREIFELVEEEIKPYVPVDLGYLGTPEEFYYKYARSFSKEIQLVVRGEGPIHRDVLARRIASAHELGKLGGRIQHKINLACQLEIANGTILVIDDFLWPVEMESPPVRHNTEYHKRDIGEISLEEISRAILLCLHVTMGISRDELISQTAKLFGFAKAGKCVKSRIDKSITQLLEEGKVVVMGDVVRPTKT